MIDFIARFVLPVATFLAGAFLQSYRTQFGESALQLNELIDEIEAARDAATKYWANAAGAGEATLAVEVRSGLHLILRLSSDLQLPDRTQFDSALDEFVEAATGGSFETAEREVDLSRALDVRMVAADLISRLRQRRRQINGWVFPLVELARGIKVWAKPYDMGRRITRLRKRLSCPKQ